MGSQLEDTRTLSIVMSAGSNGSLGCSSGPGNSSQVFFNQERCVDPVEIRQPTPEPKAIHKTPRKDADRKTSETIGFIPASAEHSSAVQTCNPCSSPRSCKTFVCSVITCGLYRFCQASVLAPNEGSPEEPERVSLRGVSPGDKKEDADTDWSDFCINGVKVVSPQEYLGVDTKSSLYAPPPGVQTQTGYSSLQESMRFDDWEDGEENVDSLITKKLLELYSEYQIEELARCTSDSVFLKKSKAITQLINSLAEEHKMDEQEAECRLVRGIIRISTRKSTKKRPPISRMERTFSDSGHETMIESHSASVSSNNDYRSSPNIQISDLTSSDKFAREMWRKNGVPMMAQCQPVDKARAAISWRHKVVKYYKCSVGIRVNWSLLTLSHRDGFFRCSTDLLFSENMINSALYVLLCSLSHIQEVMKTLFALESS